MVSYETPLKLNWRILITRNGYIKKWFGGMLNIIMGHRNWLTAGYNSSGSGLDKKFLVYDFLSFLKLFDPNELFN